MKIKTLRKRIAAGLIMAFVAIMGITAVVSGLIRLPGLDNGCDTANADERDWVLNHELNAMDPDFEANLSDEVRAANEEFRRNRFSPDDRVQLMVNVHEECLVTMYLATDRQLSFQQFLNTRAARVARENMQRRHREIFNQTARNVDAQMAFSFTSLINGFSMTMTYRDVAAADTLLRRSGAMSVGVAQYVELMRATPSNRSGDRDFYIANNIAALDGLLAETGIFMSPELDDGTVLEGEGMLVAVIDTGLDYMHPMFSDVNLPRDEHGNIMYEQLALRFDQVSGRMYSRGEFFDFSNLFASSHVLNNLTPSHTFRSHKVPFVFDYVDLSHEVAHAFDQAHGTHVSGVVAGNTPNDARYRANRNLDGSADPCENGRYVLCLHTGQIQIDFRGEPILAVRGVAPKAQILGLQSFTNFGNSPDTAVLAAVHDAAVLGADVINLSLGAQNGFSDWLDDDWAQKVYDMVDRLGISLIVAAGNSATAMRGGDFGTNLATSPDSGTMAIPGSLRQSFSVASMEGIKAPYIYLASAQREEGIAYLANSFRLGGRESNFVEEIFDSWYGMMFARDGFGQRRPHTDWPREPGTNPATSDGWGVVTPDVPAYADGGWFRRYIPGPAGLDLRRRISTYYERVVEGSSIGQLRIPFIRAGHALGASDFAGDDFTGRIALIERGFNTFTQKGENAQAANALGAIIHNHLAGRIIMTIEESVTIPMASITLDAFAAIRDFRSGYIVMHPDFAGGPFMSDFSSWGVTPDLRLKPEITGHGGEILSAHPGNRYARNSGTSMAAPNIAGLALIYRQFLTAGENESPSFPNARRFGLMNELGTRPCANKVQTHIYRMMMSTATMPRNQEGDPYSPRRVGAGLANIRNMIRSDAWIEVPKFEEIEWRVEGSDVWRGQGQRLSWSHNDNGTSSYRERALDAQGNQIFEQMSSINLFDDPQRTGVYSLEFDVVNAGDEPLRFRPVAQVFTEELAEHAVFNIITERARMLEPEVEFRANNTVVQNQLITVAAESRVTINVEINLSAADREHIESIFLNGIFIEGFIRLESLDYYYVATADGQRRMYRPDLSVPYLAFYGDWLDAPMFEYSIYETDGYRRMERPPFERPRNQMFPTTVLGRYIENNTEFLLPIGSFLFLTPRMWYNSDHIPLATESRSALSLTQNGIFSIYMIQGWMRGARRVDYRLINVDTGAQMHSGTVANARRGIGPIIELDTQTMGARNGGRYRFEVRGFLHYAREYLYQCTGWTFDEDSDRQFGFEFTVASSPPAIVNAEIRYERQMRGGEVVFSRHLDLDIQSDHYLMGKSFAIFNSRQNRFRSIWNETGLRPLRTSRNSVTRVVYDLDPLWDDLVENDFRVQMRINDFTLNSALYELDLRSLMVSAGQLTLGDSGQYQTLTHRNGNDTLSIMTGTTGQFPVAQRVYVLDNDGNFTYDEFGVRISEYEVPSLPAEGINIRRNTSINLAPMLMATENFWIEDVFWRSSNPNVVEVNQHGEIVGRGHGTATITVGSNSLRQAGHLNYSITLTVRVLSLQQEYDFGLTNTTVGDSYGHANVLARGLRPIEDRLGRGINWLDAGEQLEIEFGASPWYSLLPDIVDANGNIRYNYINGVLTPAITWASSVTSVAPHPVMDPNNPLRATVTANRGTFALYSNPNIRGSVAELLAMPGVSYQDINAGSYMINHYHHVTSITATIRLPGITMTGSVNMAARQEFVVEHGVLVRYYGCNIPGFTNAQRTSNQYINNGLLDPHLYGTIIIPSNMRIFAIGVVAFYRNPHISRVILPERFRGTSAIGYRDADYLGIMEIRSSAFAYMPNLRYVSLNSTLNTLGDFAFAAEDCRIDGITTALTTVDFSRLKAPIFVGQAAFRSQVLLGTRSSHFVYTFLPGTATQLSRTFVPGLVMRNGRAYIDDGRLVPQVARGIAALDDHGGRDEGDWRWHNVDGPSRDSTGNITDPSDTFYRRWDEQGNLVAGTFDLTKVVTIGANAFAFTRNLKFADLSNVRAMDRAAFVNFGLDVGGLPPNHGFHILDNPPGAPDLGGLHTIRDVSIVTGPLTYIGFLAFVETGINTPLVIHTPRVGELAFTFSFFIPSITFTARDVVIREGAFEDVWFNQSINFTGRYEDSNGNITGYRITPSGALRGTGAGATWQPASVEAIQSDAFRSFFGQWWGGNQHPHIHVNSVSSINFGEGVTVRRIYSEAFVGFWHMNEFTLPMGLEYLGAGAFTDFAIHTLRIPAGFDTRPDLNGAFLTLNHSAATPTNRLATIIVEGGNSMYRMENRALLRTYNTGYEIVMLERTIGTGARIPVFNIPANVVRVAPNAFEFANITRVNVPSTVELTEAMFAGNTIITTIEIEQTGITHIPNNLFDGMTSLTQIYLDTSAITHIGTAAFRNTRITSFDAPNLVQMGNHAFAQSRLTAFSFGANFNNHIATGAFDGMFTLTSINLDDIVSIGDRAFAGTGLSGAISSDSVVTIHNNAFLNLRNITSISFPNAEHIGHNAFRLNAALPTGGLINIYIPNALRIGSGAFMNQNREMRVSSLDYLYHLGADTFRNTNASQYLVHPELPNPIRLGTIYMPRARHIGDRAFMNNVGLMSTFVVSRHLGEAPPTGEGQDPWGLGYLIQHRTDRHRLVFDGEVYIRTGTFSRASFTGLGSSVFASTRITDFAISTSDSGITPNYRQIGGALFRLVPNGYELVAYPNAATRDNWAIPEGTVRIDDSVFVGNTILRTVTLPSTLTTIGDRAFFNTNIDTFRFNSFIAPRLEAWYFSYESMNIARPDLAGSGDPRARAMSDQREHAWVVYANFVGYFTPGSSALVQNAQGHTIRLDETQFIFNPISRAMERDLFRGIPTTPESRFTGTCFGLTIERPLNGMGFDSFIFTHYFANVRTIPYVLETGTSQLIQRARALEGVDISALTDAEFRYFEAEVNELRGNLESIMATSAHQMRFVVEAGADIIINDAALSVAPRFVQPVIDIINTLPASFDAANTAHMATLRAVRTQFNNAMDIRPHYIEFVTNRQRLFDIDVDILAGEFLSAVRGLPNPPFNLDNVQTGDLSALTTARSIGDTLVGAEPQLIYPLRLYRAFLNEAIAKIQGAPTLIFNSQGGGAVSPMRVFENQRAVAPIPTRAGFVFVGWTFRGELFDFNTPITQDMTLFAQWSSTITVSFNTNGGPNIADQTVQVGGTVTMPPDPVRDGYIFMGWYLNGEAFDFESAVLDMNLTLEARWEPDETGKCGSCASIGAGDVWPLGLMMIAVLMGVVLLVQLRKRKPSVE